MIASQSTENNNNQANGNYRTRQDLVRILMEEKRPLEERQTHLAIFDFLDGIRRNRRQLLGENKWDAYLIALTYDRTNNGLRINGRHKEIPVIIKLDS